MLKFTYEVIKVSKKKDSTQYLLEAVDDTSSNSEEGVYIKLRKMKLKVYGTPDEHSNLELGQRVHFSLTRIVE